MNTNSEISCDVVLDLVAIYKDGYASDDTRALVRSHLRSCPECRRLYAEYHVSQDVRASIPDLPTTPANGYTALARDMRSHQLLSNAAMIGVMALSALVGTWSLMTMLSEGDGEDAK